MKITDLFDMRGQLIPSHSFLVAIGALLLSFSRVSNLTAQIEYDTVTEGGNNDYPYLFPKAKTKPDTLILEKGVRARMTDVLAFPLVEGLQVEEVTILLLKNKVNLEKVFFFKKGLIVRRQFSNLDALKGELLIETLEIAHSGLIEIPIPSVI